MNLAVHKKNDFSFSCTCHSFLCKDARCEARRKMEDVIENDLSIIHRCEGYKTTYTHSPVKILKN